MKMWMGGLARRHWRDALGVFAVCVVVIVGYSEIALGSKTFSMQGRVSGLDGPACVSAADLDSGGARNPLELPACVRVEEHRFDFRRDPGASSWQMNAWAPVVNDQVDDGATPLWNPFQGIGAPLAGNMQSGVFDPLLLPLHLQPTQAVFDLSMLFGLMLIGVATYAFARVLGLLFVASTVAASIFVLSGWFFGYSNLEWFRTYLYLPLILCFVELCVRSRRAWPVAGLAIALAGIWSVGMPEPAFMAVAASATYALFRLCFGPRASVPRWVSAFRLSGAAVIGMALAAPLLLLFVEYLGVSHNIHKDLGAVPQVTAPLPSLLNWVVPTISETPTSVYDGTSNWVGAGAFVLALIAFASPRAMKRYLGWPILIVGFAVGFKIYGGGLVDWTRHIPVSNLALWAVFGTPIIALAVAMLAGIGVQVVSDGSIDRKRVLGVIGIGLLVAIVFVATTESHLALGRDNFDLFGGWGLAAVSFLAAVLAALFIAPRRASWVIAGVVILELVLLAPRGVYEERSNPYPQTAWLSFVQRATDRDHGRVYSAQDLLYPDTAGVYGLGDLRMVDALFVDRYFTYLQRFVVPTIVDRFTSDTAANIEENSMFDLLGTRYLIARTGSPRPPSQFRLVFEAQNVRVYENAQAFPRAFVVHEVTGVTDRAEATRYLAGGEARFPDGAVNVTRKDLSKQAVIEVGEGPAPTPRPSSCAHRDASSARIASYSPTNVRIEVETKCPGLLVLSDAYYPGWTATVNGSDASIYPTDLALRGVRVPAGKSVVDFRYRPLSFRVGLIAMILGMVGVAALILADVRARWRRKTRASNSDGIESTPATAPEEVRG